MCGVVGRWCGRAVERAVGCVEWLRGRAAGRQGVCVCGVVGGWAAGR